MKSSFVVAMVLGVILVQSQGLRARKCFAQICSSNPHNVLRRCDGFGCGNFLAPRGEKRHKGIDIKCDAGSDIYAPFPATVIGPAWPYPLENPQRPHNVGIHMRGRGKWKGYRLKLFYVKKSVSRGENVDENTVIGKMTDMKAQFGNSMTNHVHLQMEIRRNGIVYPTPFVC